MRTAVKLALPLLLLLAVVTWGAADLVNQTGHRWFERDVQLRSTLAVNGARYGLVRAWNQGNAEPKRNRLDEEAEETARRRELAARELREGKLCHGG